MSKYVEKSRAHLQRLVDLIAATENPRHKAILENYLAHNALEVGYDQWPDVFRPEFVVDQPVYQAKMPGEDTVTVLDGMQAVQAFYAQLAASTSVFVNEDDELAVADWGVAMHTNVYFFGTGEQFASQGAEVDSPDALYVVASHMAQFWHYDEDCRLVGENFYALGNLGSGRPERVADEDLFTREDLIAAVKPFRPVLR